MAAPYITAAVPKITDAAAKDRAGQPEIALPLYIQAIEALLVGASADTNAKRVDAIRTKVDRWLQAAEGIDANLEVAESGRLQALLKKLEREQPPTPPPSMGGYGGYGGGGPAVLVQATVPQQYGDLPAPIMPTAVPPSNQGGRAVFAPNAPGAPPEPHPGPSVPMAPVHPQQYGDLGAAIMPTAPSTPALAVFAPPGAQPEPYPGPSVPMASAGSNDPPLLPGFPPAGTVNPRAPTAPQDWMMFNPPPDAATGAGLLMPTRVPPPPPPGSSAPRPLSAGLTPTGPPTAPVPQYPHPAYSGQPAPGSPSSGRASLYADLSHGLGGLSGMSQGGGSSGGGVTAFPTATNLQPSQPPQAPGGPPPYAAAMLNSDIPVVFEPSPPQPPHVPPPSSLY